MATQAQPKPAVTKPRPDPMYQWFTTCPQDWFALVVRGQDLHRIIHSIKGWHSDENFVFQPGDDSITPIRGLFGADFVGIPRFQGLFTYTFAWNKYWRRKNADGSEEPEYTVQTHDQEIVYFTPFESQYPLMYGGIDVLPINNNQNEPLIPITLTITVRVRMINPRVALMTNTDWLGQVVTPNIQRAAKDFAGDKTYDWMIRHARDQASEQFSDQFMSPTGGLNKFKQLILEKAGVEITDIGITDIKPNKVFEEALLAQAVAERTAQAAIKTAEGAKQARILLAESEKEYQRLVGEGNAARIIAEAEAERQRIEKTSVYAAGGPGRDAIEREKWVQMTSATSKLTTYVEGGAKGNVGILIGADGKPISS